MTQLELNKAQDALLKLTEYGYLPAGQVFYLAQRKAALFNEVLAFNEARNALLRKYGQSADGKHYTINGEAQVKEYERELDELGAQAVPVEYDASRIVLCVETVERTDERLVPEKRLGFTACDWENIKPVCQVVLKEE